MKSGQTLHLVIAIDYAERLPDLSELFTVEGKPSTDAEVRAELQELKAAGFEFIPACDDYDEKGRCRGHRFEAKLKQLAWIDVSSCDERMHPETVWRQK